MNDNRYWNTDVQTLPRDQRRQLLADRLSSQLDYVYNNSEFYRERLSAVGFTPGSVRDFESFRQLPVLFTKEDERKSLEDSFEMDGHPFGRHLCASPEEVRYRQATSGTSGMPTWYLFTQQDYSVFTEAGARYWHWCGVRPGDTVLFAMGSGMWVSALFVSALRDMGACPLPVGLEAGVEKVLQYAKLCKPTSLLATPSLCRMMIEEAPKLIGVPVSDLGIRQLILGGEPGAGLPAVRRELEGAFGASVYDIIGPFWGNAYASCTESEYQGLHCLTDDLAVWHQDLRNPVTGEAVEAVDGAIGEAITSGGSHQAAPMVKFGSGDVVTVSTGACKCGFDGDRIRIVGRAADMLSIRDKLFFPHDIVNAVAGSGPAVTGEIRIRLTAPPPSVQEPLPVIVECKAGVSPVDEELRARIQRHVRGLVGVETLVELVPHGSLERSMAKSQVLMHEYP